MADPTVYPDLNALLRELVEGAREILADDFVGAYSLCRILHTDATGTVTSKREAGEWALRHLDAKWATLIERALDERSDPWARYYEPADAVLIEQTLAFVDYVAHSNSHQPA